MVNFRPINLRNVIYKVLSKVLINRRIKSILKNLVEKTQNTFVSNRLITDNIIIAYEIFHWLKSDKRAPFGGAYAIKIDMNKSDDRVEYS